MRGLVKELDWYLACSQSWFKQDLADAILLGYFKENPEIETKEQCELMMDVTLKTLRRMGHVQG